MMRRKMSRGVKFIVIPILCAIVLYLVCLLVMGLWNWLMPAIFGLKAITFWQTLGLLFLSRFLFGGFRGRSRGSMHWRHRMKERWERMTPEEREQFRAGMRARCGHAFDPPAETPTT
jgi:Ca2+/H+ antiporter, TMEM165/GDT1 family